MRTFLALAAGLGMAASAVADRPLVSETADVIDSGACQIESALSRSRASGSDAVRLFGATFSCGIGLKTQLALGAERERAGSERATGLLLGGKTTLVAPESDRTGYGVAYTLTGGKSAGSSLRFEELSLSGLITRELRDGLLGHANLGWKRARVGSRNTTVWSLGMETAADFTIAADVFGDDRGRPAVSLGMGTVLTPGLSVNLAVAQQFETPRVRQTSVGLKVAF
jgi:hypothetical protein